MAQLTDRNATLKKNYGLNSVIYRCAPFFVSLQRVSGSSQGLLPVWHTRNTSPGRRPGGIPTTCQSHLSWFPMTRGSSGSTPGLSNFSFCLCGHHTEQTSLSCLCLQPYSSCHDPKLVTRGESENADWLVNRELLTQHSFHEDRLL